MTQTDREIETGLAAEPLPEMPLPTDPKTIFLGGLFVLALLAAAYVASEIVLPVVFAFTLKLLLQPLQRLLERLKIPRALAALLIILVLFGTIVGLGTAISGPAGHWAAKLPEGIPRLEERLSFLRAPINTLQQFLQQATVESEHHARGDLRRDVRRSIAAGDREFYACDNTQTARPITFDRRGHRGTDTAGAVRGHDAGRRASSVHPKAISIWGFAPK